MSCSYQFFRLSHDLFLKKSDQTSHLGCELVAGLFESEGDRLLSLLLLELLPPSPPVLLPVQEEANTWAWFAYWAVLLKKNNCTLHQSSSKLPGWVQTVWAQWDLRSHWRWQKLFSESCYQPPLQKIFKKHFCIHVRVWAKGVTLFTFTDRKAPWSLIKMWGGGVWGRSAVRSWKDSFSHIFPY